MHRWDEETVRHIYDSVLVSSVLEFRRALELVEGGDAAASTYYVHQIREGLRVMEQELDRRGLHVLDEEEPQPQPRSPRHHTTTDAST